MLEPELERLFGGFLAYSPGQSEGLGKIGP
jgi:hypothetical protein